MNSGSVCFVEWPEKAPELFDEEAWHVIIETINENVRRIKIQTTYNHLQMSDNNCNL